MKKKYIWVCLVFVVLLSACAPKKAGDIETKIFNLESDFKENYQLWVDMKADGSIQYKEYVTDLKSVATKFNSIGDKAKLSSYKKLLSEEDQTIYETYRLLSKDIKSMATAIHKKNYEEADKIYQGILDTEENLKE
ncbi:hypothetical protein [Enterococcus sp. CWB-B31]|uniref:hypothetical protein n=1 Tax=Enterococcus sp. CWB-B31 TaxID=2885159 RepID=UPI001E58E89C|nr:hypothetical protein [Enterococcus sp. CWB-B31]MCB5955152.1 hypothetical protein [Enterococcus sp. CWB-B31]